MIQDTLSVLCGSQSAAESVSKPPAPNWQKAHGKLMTLFTDFLQNPDEINDPIQRKSEKIKMQRYMVDVITDQYDSRSSTYIH